jgi:hypothetical protein
MASLRDILQPYVSDGPVPGVVALVARGERAEVEVIGHADAEGRTAMARDSIFRIVAAIEPWNVPGRYGWVGGTGTAAHIVPATGMTSILLTQLAMTDPTPPALMRDFWRYAATG